MRTSTAALFALMFVSFEGCGGVTRSTDDSATGGAGGSGGSTCNPACTANDVCCAGQCVNLQQSPSDCGNCGVECDWDEFCVKGQCTFCDAVLLWVDPDSVNHENATEVTLHGAYLDTVEHVLLVNCTPPQSAGQIELVFEHSTKNQLKALVPSNLVPGTCDLRITSANGCEGGLRDGIHIN